MNPTFPTVDFSTGLDDFQRQQSLDRIARSVGRVCALARDAQNLTLLALEIVAEITTLLKRNARWLHASGQTVAAYVLMWIAPVAACCIDYLLLGSVLEYFALRVYAGDSGMISMTRVVIPLVIVTIEMFIAAQRAHAQEEAADSGYLHLPAIWRRLPLMMLIPLPALVVATNIAAAIAATSTGGGALQAILALEIIGLVALSVVAHAIVLYGGQLAADARGYVFSKIQLRQRKRKHARLRKTFAITVQQLIEAHTRHLRLIEDHNQRFGTRLVPGPFDRVTQEVLADHFGGDPDQTELRFRSETNPDDDNQTPVF